MKTINNSFLNKLILFNYFHIYLQVVSSIQVATIIKSANKLANVASILPQTAAVAAIVKVYVKSSAFTLCFSNKFKFIQINFLKCDRCSGRFYRKWRCYFSNGSWCKKVKFLSNVKFKFKDKMQ